MNNIGAANEAPHDMGNRTSTKVRTALCFVVLARRKTYGRKDAIRWLWLDFSRLLEASTITQNRPMSIT
jgi:hypothetical protein